MPRERLTRLLERRFLYGERVMLSHVYLKKGCLVPKHRHENEQVSCVLTGALRFQFDDREVVVGAGGVMHIPGGIAHEVTVLEDTLVLDIFSPVRQDWIDGTDTYFTRRD